MLEKQWKTIEGEKIEDILVTFSTLVSKPGREVHIGTDSQQSGKYTQYVTVLVVLTPGKGGRAFYLTERVFRIKSLRERLLKEVWMSTALGMEIHPHMPETNDLTIHVDANTNPIFKSSDYVKELTSMVVSQGFKVLLKPDSWCSSHVADHTVKVRVIGR